jgi:mono/diheme cytochrome c family protein
MTGAHAGKGSTMPMHSSNIRAHGAFILVASMLAMQGCGGAVVAEPAPAETAATATTVAAEHVAAKSQIDAGRYLVKIGGCNDCHTPGYVQTNGASPAEPEWLTGDAMGYSGPWGVSYPANLRLSFQNMTEKEFIDMARAGQGRPPMPWPSLMSMSDQDLGAIYVYIRSMGPKGEPAPAPLSPGVEPDRPHIPFIPQMPKKT